MTTSTNLSLPAGWQWLKLGKICEPIRGVTFSRGELTSEQFDDGVACLTSGGVQDQIDWDSRRYIPRSRLQNERQFLRVGDLLVSTANSKVLVGKSSIVDNLPFECTFGAFVTVLRPSDLVDPYFLAQWLRTPSSIRYFYERSSETTNISNLRVSELLALQIPLPPRLEQQRIVTILRQADELRGLRRQANEKTHNFITELFYEMFGDAASNSKRWQTKPLGSVVNDIQPGFAQRPNAEGIGIPQLRTNNISRDGEINIVELKYVQADEQAIERYGLQKGDVIFNNTNSPELVGKTALFDLEGQYVFSNHMTRIRTDWNSLDSQYLAVLLHILWKGRTLYRWAKHWVNQAAIDQTALSKIEIPLPPLNLQRSLSERVSEIRRVQKQQELVKTRLDGLFESLLAQAFTGELSAQWREAHRVELARAAEEMRKQLQSKKLSVEIRIESGTRESLAELNANVAAITAKLVQTLPPLSETIAKSFAPINWSKLALPMPAMTQFLDAAQTLKPYTERFAEIVNSSLVQQVRAYQDTLESIQKSMAQVSEHLRQSTQLFPADLAEKLAQLAQLQMGQPLTRSQVQEEIIQVISELPRYWTLNDLTEHWTLNHIARNTIREAVDMLVVLGKIRLAFIRHETNDLQNPVERIYAFTCVIDIELVTPDAIQL